MNNNNLYNINSWIGSTHQDFFKNSSNNLYFYTSNSSNILSNQIIITSNILETSSTNKTSNLKYNINKLINEETEHISLPIPYDKIHTYIYNSNVVGEIRFWCKSTTDFPIINPIGVPNYRTKIDIDGKLKIYYTYDPLISLTFGNGWIDIANSIVNLNSADANFVISMAGLEAQINNNYNLLEQQIIALIFASEKYTLMTETQRNQILLEVQNQAELVRLGQQSMPLALSSIREATLTSLPQYLTNGLNIVTALIVNNPITASFLGATGAAFYFIANKIYEQEYNTRTLGLMYSNVSNMVGITETKRNELYSNIKDERVRSLINITSNEYNINLIQGFTNSNILTTQNIPNIKTSNINVSNIGSTTYSTINFSNATNNSAGYIGLGGIVSGYHNNNIIYNTPSAHIFNVPGQNSLSIPAFSINASSCVGININPSAWPLYRLSVAGDVYIHNAALRTNSIIYNSQELSTTLNNYLLKSGGTMTGALTTNSIIYNNVELSTTLTDYLLKAGGTMTGRIVFNTGYYQDPSPTGFGDRIVLQSGGLGYAYSVGINTDVFWHSAPSTASYKFYSGAINTATLNNTGLLTLSSINATTSITTPSIIYGGTELNTTIGNYLLKSGGTMTGQLAITANSASSLISLTNTGTVGQGILQTNNLGGYARLTYYNSGAGGYYTGNYVLEASSNNACIVLNTGGNTSNSIPRIILLSSGNVGIGISNPSAKLEVNGKIGCIGTLNCWSNVGIGATNPYTLFHMRGTNPALTIMAQGGAGATSTINLSTYDHTTNSTNCALIATDNGNFGATFQIRQKMEGADTNGLFTSFIMDKDGNVGIGTTTLTSIKFYVGGKATFQDIITLANSQWHKSADNIDRFYYNPNGTTFFHSGNSDPAFVFRSFAQSDIVTISNSGNIAGNNISGSVGTFSGNISSGTNSYVYAGNMRIGGWDANSLYNGARDFGITCDSGYNINFNLWNGTVNTKMTVNNNNVNINTLTRSIHYFNWGETLSYQASFDQVAMNGWFFTTNRFWQDISTISYLHIAIQCSGISGVVWYGRGYLASGGGFYGLVCDYRNPTNGATNQIDVSDRWGANGWNVIRIQINATYGGNMIVKVSG